MTDVQMGMKTHPAEAVLADYLSNTLSEAERARVEEHVASCGSCLEAVVSAHDALKVFGKTKQLKKGNIMKKLNIYLLLAVVSFVLSFAIRQYFVQFLVATLLLGVKWIADSKSAKMLVMIYEAWKNGGEKEASRILNVLDAESKNRLK